MAATTHDRRDAAPRALLIAGPTASGKSALALTLAERYGGEIVNADSMQVYTELEVLTARPAAADLARAPHHLYGAWPASHACSAADWGAAAARAIDEIEARGRLPILVGGTGLYFEALTDGLSPIPPIPSEIREAVRMRVTGDGAASAHRELAQLDPELAARLPATDSQRIARGLEVATATGRTLSDWQREPLRPLAPGPFLKLRLDPERDWLHERIDRRFDAMLDAGALAEVEALLALGLPATLPVMKALGVPQLKAHLRGKMALEIATEDAKRESRRYAKRQQTWFRNRMISWNPLSAQFSKRQLAEIFSFIDESGLTGR